MSEQDRSEAAESSRAPARPDRQGQAEPDYEPPALTVLGTLSELTHGASTSSGSDGTFTGSLVAP